MTAIPNAHERHVGRIRVIENRLRLLETAPPTVANRRLTAELTAELDELRADHPAPAPTRRDVDG